MQLVWTEGRVGKRYTTNLNRGRGGEEICN